MSGDDFDALQALAADNARLCEIALAADLLAEAVQRYAKDDGDRRSYRAMVVALEAYKVVRQGT